MKTYSFFSRSFWKKISKLFLIILLINFAFIHTGYSQEQISVTRVDYLFHSASISAMMQQYDEFIKFIEENPELIDYTSVDGVNLVFSASSSPQTLKFLIDKGMSLNVKANNGNTPLHTTGTGLFQTISKETIADAVKMFVDSGVDINAKNNDGHTPLYNAISNNNTIMIEVLVGYGAELDIISAVEIKDIEQIESILSENPDDIHKADSQGLSLIHRIFTKDDPNQEEVFNVLLKYGADINAEDIDGKTPLHYAVENQQDDNVEILLSKGADGNARTKSEETPLHIAVKKGFWRIALSLIEHGVDINLEDELGFTPLAYAELYDKPMIAEMLKEKGALPFNRDIDPDKSWNDYLKNPYSDASLFIHLCAFQENPVIEFENWYISGVYLAEKAFTSPLYITQIYNGTDKSFKLGCLIVFDSDGKIVRTIPEERIDVGFFTIFNGLRLIETDYYENMQKRVENGEIINLPDINHDSFSDIPSERWDGMDNTYSIYLTNDDSIPRVFCIRPNSQSYLSIDTEPEQIMFMRTSENEPAISVLSQAMIRKGNSVSLDYDKQPEIVETYIWDSAENTFVETLHTSEGRWEIIE